MEQLDRRDRVRTRLGCTGLAVLLVATVVAARPVEATVHEIRVPFDDGSIELGGLVVPVGEGAALEATWNDLDGEVAEGLLSVPDVELGLGIGQDVTVHFRQIGRVTGSIDPSTGVARLVARHAVSLDGDGMSGGCESSPIRMVLRTAEPGVPFDFEDGSVGLAAADVDVPALVECHSTDFGDFTDLLNNLFGLPSGDASALFEGELDAEPPSRPRKPFATGRDRAARVSWTAPAFSGGAPIVRYRVVSSPGGKACVTRQLRCTITGLQNGKRYVFTVAAKNLAGFGASSVPTETVEPAA